MELGYEQIKNRKIRNNRHADKIKAFSLFFFLVYFFIDKGTLIFKAITKLQTALLS